MSAGPPRAASHEKAVEQLRELLLGRAEAMRETIGERRSIIPLLEFELDKRRVAEDRSEAATLAKLFLLSAPVAKEDAERALAPLDPAALEELGLATLDKEDQRPHCWRQYDAACEQERRENDRKAHRDDNGY